MKKIAVIAGTPIDTNMGIDCINFYNKINNGAYDPICLNAFENPRQCHVFQMASFEEKDEIMSKLFKKGINQGCEIFFIYCNSLSAAYDYKTLGERLNVKVITPLMAYAKLAEKYKKIGVIAANNQATAGIEKAFTDANQNCYVNGIGMLQLVEAVESEMPAAEIVSKFELKKLAEFFKDNNAEALVLGCTHFPYFKDELKRVCDLEIIDPAEIMYNMI